MAQNCADLPRIACGISKGREDGSEMVRDAVGASPVSGGKFPVMWEFTGNIVFFGSILLLPAPRKAAELLTF